MSSAAVLPEHWVRSPSRHPVGRGWVITLTIAATAAVFYTTAAGVGWMLGASALGVLGCVLVWHRPFVGLMALVVVGVLHQFLMLLVFSATGPSTALRVVQSWKEVVVLILLARVVDQAFRRRVAPRLLFLDVAIAIFIAVASLYLVYPSSVEEATLVSAIYGLRADAFFLLAYFVGRALPLSPAQVRVLLLTFGGIVVVNAVVGAVQFIAPDPTNEFFEAIGYRAYLEAQRGEVAGVYAVRQNEVSGAIITRASSLFLSDLALAFYSLMVAPLMMALFVTSTRVSARLAYNGLLLAALGTLVLTVTRSAMVAIVPALLAMTLVRRSFGALAMVAVQIALIVTPIAYTVGITPSLLRDIWSPNEASAQGHLAAVELSLALIAEEPFGRGLGTSGTVAQRFTPQGGVTNESWYLQIATEIGVLPALLFGAIVALAGVLAFTRYAQVRGRWLQALCLGMGGGVIGLGVVGFALHAWDGLTTSVVFWLLIGVVARAPTLEADSSAVSHEGEPRAPDRLG